MRVRYVAEGQEAVGELVDVSRSGLSIAAAEQPRPGAIAAVQFESPDGKLVDARGQVRWRDAAEGAFGVRIHEPPREFRDFVAWALAQSERLPGESE